MIYAENILICIAAPLLISTFFTDRKVRLYTVFFCVGMGICLISAYINGYLAIVGSLSTRHAAVYISPVIEEVMKFLPLLFYLLLFEPRVDEIFPASIAVGTGFATFENCCYILSSGADKLTYILIRGLSTGVMHVVSILALALGIMLVMWLKVMSFPAIVGVLSLSVTFHALYNLLLSKPGTATQIGYMIPVLTAAVLYLPYRNIRRNIIAEEPVPPEE